MYRFVSLGVTNPVAQRALADGRIATLSDDALAREIVGPNGAIEQVSSRAAEMLMGGVPVPPRFGGGFLFWDSGALYRARSFCAPLEPVASLPTNAIGVEFGPSYVLVFLEDSAPRAFGLDPARPLPLSPHGVIEVAALEDGRALALDATGRALASTDAGKTWRDVTSTAGAVRGLTDEGSEIALVSNKNLGAWLQKDGQLSQGPFAPRAPAEPRPAEALLRAVMGGLPLPDGRILTSDKRGMSLVDPRSGSAQPTTALGFEASSCRPLSLEDEGLAACFSQDKTGTTTTVVSHVLSASPRAEKRFTGATLRIFPGRTLNVIAGCDGARSEGVTCVRAPGGTWSETRLAAELLQQWQPLWWLPRETGGTAVIASERNARAPHLALLDPQTETATQWDAPSEQVNPSSLSAEHQVSFREFADGSVRGFTFTGSIAVDPKGHVSRGEHTFESVTNAGAHGLARDSSKRLWQSNDWGAHWLEIAPPPFDSTLEGAGAKEDPRPAGHGPDMHCSSAGCVIDHSSGVGSWLRLGWPNDPPTRAATATRPRESLSTAAPAPERALPVIPTLHCAPTKREARTAPSAGKPAPAQKKQRANIEFHDLFSTAEDYQRGGLRASFEFDAKSRAAQSAPTGRFNARFVEPFDPRARTRQLTGSLTGAARERRIDDAGARPVLSPMLGHAGGALIIDGSNAFALSSSNKLLPLPGGCAPTSGYVDAKGKLLIACGAWSGATRIEDASNGLVLWSSPAAAHGHDEKAPGMHFFPPAAPVFQNPDAIAVGDDGKPAILRLPPGVEPPTQDNPAWLLSNESAPIELAPWSTLELASSQACAHSSGYRAIVQASQAWLNTDASRDHAGSPMSALVRWSTERVCLEAVELNTTDAGQLSHVVARFVGSAPGAAFVSVDASFASTVTPITCKLEASP